MPSSDFLNSLRLCSLVVYKRIYIKIVVIVNASISVDKSVNFFKIICLRER